MYQIKSDLKKLKRIFILSQIVILFVALTVLFVIMILGYREKVLHILLLRLDATTESMANQLKANQVPLSSTNEHGIFIINQNDGTLVIDRHNDTQIDEKLWSSYRTKLIYEMQKQKRGWVIYPDKQWWNLYQQQKIIRYIPIDELGWIIAIEASRPTEIELLKEVVRPSVYLTLLFVAFLGAGVLWLMTDKYFRIIRRQISQMVDSNLMSLGGEEKVWEDFSTKTSPIQDDLQNETSGLSLLHEVASPSLETIKDFPESQLPLKTPQSGHDLRIIKEKQPQKASQVDNTYKQEEPRGVVHEESSLDQLTINVNNITSPILKKIIQQFRNK